MYIYKRGTLSLVLPTMECISILKARDFTVGAPHHKMRYHFEREAL